MADAFSIATGIVTLLGVAGKILQKCGEIRNAVPHIQHILTAAEDFKAMITLLQSLLLENSEEAFDNQRLLKVVTLMRVLKGCTDTFEQLEEGLDGLMEGDMRIGRSHVGTWMWGRGDILTLLRNLDSHKLTLSLILDILNSYVLFTPFYPS